MSITFEDLASKKVRLEFGNQEQIKIIDKVQRAKEEAEQLEIERVAGHLKKYRVRFSVTGYTFVDIEACDEFQAADLAENLADPDSAEELEIDLNSDPDVIEL